MQSSLVGGCARTKPDTSPIPFLDEPTGSTFSQIDKNRDGELGFETFHRGLSEHYYFRQGLDLDGDEVVLQPELATAFFELWDDDDDRKVSRAEWEAGMAVWFPDRLADASFPGWDGNADESLDVIELGEGAVRAGTFDAYDLDGDGTSSTREVSRYLFDQWDTNEDEVVDANEWPLP